MTGRRSPKKGNDNCLCGYLRGNPSEGRLIFRGTIKACAGHFAVNLQGFRQEYETRVFLWIETKKEMLDQVLKNIDDD